MTSTDISPDRSDIAAAPRKVGRYLLYGPIARGGMATVHFARLVGESGFSRTVAAKRLHEHFADDPEFIEMFENEARIASRIHHPNVVPVLDLVMEGGEVILVQEYVHGVSLDKLFRAAAKAHEPIPPRIAVAILAGVLAGLHASHEAKDERGESLGVIHRDVTPHNVVVGEDGVPRVLDFGIAKARTNSNETQQGLLKGKLMYMAPEQFRGEKATRLVDEYAAGVVLWELCTLRRLHAGHDDISVVTRSTKRLPPIVHSFDGARTATELAALGAIDAIVQRMTDRTMDRRFPTTYDAMEALVRAVAPASAADVGAWVKRLGAEHLDHCRELLAQNEDSWRSAPRVTEPQSTSGYEIRTANEILDAEEARAKRPGKRRTLLRMLACAAVVMTAVEAFVAVRRELGPAPRGPAVMPAWTPIASSARTELAAPPEAVAPSATVSASAAPNASAAPRATAHPMRTAPPPHRTQAPRATATHAPASSSAPSGEIPDFGGRL